MVHLLLDYFTVLYQLLRSCSFDTLAGGVSNVRVSSVMCISLNIRLGCSLQILT
jgi:hypothetical protein